jgi:hypothetical protein
MTPTAHISKVRVSANGILMMLRASRLKNRTGRLRRTGFPAAEDPSGGTRATARFTEGTSLTPVPGRLTVRHGAGNDNLRH